jgi:hypothetical protein
MLNWDHGDRSTGPVYAMSNPGYYDLRGAKRYIRANVRVGLNGVTTSGADQEGSRVGATFVFMGADRLPIPADTTSPFSSSTSTA